MPEVSSQEMVEQIEEAIADEEMELTDWETDFLENVKRRIAADVNLSDKQDEILLKLWKRSRGE